MTRAKYQVASLTKRSYEPRQRPRVLPDFGGGKPCPTCYAPMEPQGKTWACTKHGEPTRP